MTHPSLFLTHKTQQRVTFTIFIVLFLLSPFLLHGRSTVLAAVVINEAFPKTTDVTQGWIELFNNGPDSVSLDRWTLENSVGDKKTFMFNASSIIPANGFLTFSQPQTGITMSVNGDTIKLSNEKNETQDTQSYSGTLGYNTSIGRSTDGGGSWAPCTAPTKNVSNNCPPLPTNTPTPIPTPAPTTAPVLTPLPTPTLVPPITPISIIADAPSYTYRATPIPTPTLTPTPSDNITLQLSKSLMLQIGIVLCAWGLLATIAALNRNKPRHSRPIKTPENSESH